MKNIFFFCFRSISVFSHCLEQSSISYLEFSIVHPLFSIFFPELKQKHVRSIFVVVIAGVPRLKLFGEEWTHISTILVPTLLFEHRTRRWFDYRILFLVAVLYKILEGKLIPGPMRYKPFCQRPHWIKPAEFGKGLCCQIDPRINVVSMQHIKLAFQLANFTIV